jgi:hypothetical protein
MDNKQIAKIWIDFVRKNYDNLKSSVDFLKEGQRNFISVRNIMAEMGVEVTPGELQSLERAIRETIEYIDREKYNE